MNQNFDPLKLSIEAAMPNNTVIYDDLGLPSVMVRIPKFRICDVIEGGSDAVHPAFIVDGREVPEIFVSKYSNVVIENRAYSLPARDPAAGDVIHDVAKAACERKGRGWHLMSNAEWSAIALWCKKNGYMPSGNNAFAKDVYKTYERGTVSFTYDKNGEMKEGRTLTGSGPVAWAHDNSPAGIYDMNGNVWAQLSGLRLVDGEIQITPNNDSAMALDESENSLLWKAILPDGTLVAPGTPGTLKMTVRDGKPEISTEITGHPAEHGVEENGLSAAWASCKFDAMGAACDIPEILKTLCLFPADKDGYGEQMIWFVNRGERFPWRGGTWDAYQYSGVFCTFMCYPRAHESIWMGFRSAYVEL